MRTLKRTLKSLPLTLALLAVLGVAPAHAQVYRTFTTFAWQGTPCVTVESPIIGNTEVCDSDGFFQINETVVQSGQWVGVRIPLTGQTYIGCSAWLGPDGGLQSVFAKDSAESALGAGEADCLRQVP